MSKKDSAKKIEETIAADTLAPNGGTGGTMKMQAINLAVAAIANMSPEDLSHFYNDTLAKFGHYGDGVENDAAAKNAATVVMKPSAAVTGGLAKEDLETLFGTELTEENKLKVTTLFETAVNVAVEIEKTKLTEEHSQKLVEEVSTIKEELSNNIDKYLTYSIKEWVKNNEVAIQSSLKTDKVESFMEGLKELFVNHYIEVPEEQVDLVAEMQTEISELTDKLNETIKEKMTAEEQIESFKKNEVFEEVVGDMPLTQVEKLRQLSETFKNENIETYKTKLNVLKESALITTKVPAASNILTETFDATSDTIKSVEPSIQRYVDAINRTVKK